MKWFRKSFIVRPRLLLRALRLASHPRVTLRGTAPRIGSGCLIHVEKGGILDLGADCTLDRGVELVVYAGGTMTIGNDVYIGHDSTIACSKAISVGSDSMIGDMVSIRDMNHRRLPGVPLRKSGIDSREIRIGQNCWLGSKVTILAGADLGDDVTVAANGVASGRIEAGAVVGGVPARPLSRNNSGA